MKKESRNYLLRIRLHSTLDIDVHLGHQSRSHSDSELASGGGAIAMWKTCWLACGGVGSGCSALGAEGGSITGEYFLSVWFR